MRNSLFLDAVKTDLADPGDVLVTRKKSGTKTVKEKHIDNIWTLVGVINRCECVPLTVLKNGKRGKVEFVRSQAKQREVREKSDIVSDTLVHEKEDEGCVSEDALVLDVVNGIGPMRDMEATTVARILVDEFFCRYGMPDP